MSEAATDIVRFTRMADGSAEDYQLLARRLVPHAANMRGELQRFVVRLLHEEASYELGYQINRLQHSLQTATRALRDRADEETVVVALLHDVGDGIGFFNHSEFVASLLRPFISEQNHWVLKHHGLFQGYYYYHHLGLDRNARDRFRDHPHFDACVRFCDRWDQCSFDPHYDTLPFEAFESLVDRLFSREPHARE
jgi:predicted HD phosphohydrolase